MCAYHAHMQTPDILPVDDQAMKRWWWRIVGANGEVMAFSETYSSRWNRNRAVRRLAVLTGWKVRPPEPIEDQPGIE